MPQVRISPRYLDMMKRARGNKTDAQTKDFLKRKLRICQVVRECFAAAATDNAQRHAGTH